MKMTFLVTSCAMCAVALIWRCITAVRRSIRDSSQGWEKALSAIYKAVMAGPFCVRRSLALELFILAIGAPDGERNIHRRNTIGGEVPTVGFETLTK